MSTPHLVMWIIVAVIGIPSAWRNPTATALALAWLAGELIYVLTGNNLPVSFYLFPDIFVIAAILVKREYCNQQPYRGTWHQLSCLLLERSPADRVILLIFAAMWLIYIAPLHPYYAWWSLYFLAVLQFLAAGWESLSLYRRDLGAASDTPDNPGALLVAYERRGYG